MTSSHTQEQFDDMVERSKEAIRAGEAFQIVVSQRFSLPCPAPTLDVYRALRASNPSPYMYFFRLPHPDGSAYDIVGSSPEALVKVTGRRVITHPIAGSRPRGKTPRGRRPPRRGAARRRRRSGPSTSCSSTSRATTSSGSATPAPSTRSSS